MKRTMNLILMGVMLIAPTAVAFAADIDALDKVSVLMPRSKVVSLLGAPDGAERTTGGLKVDLYNVDIADSLVGAGYLYEDEGALAGNAFIFRGNVAKRTAERLKEIGFTLLDEKGATFRLSGKDDDTGRPIVVTIGENNDLTNRSPGGSPKRRRPTSTLRIIKNCSSAAKSMRPSSPPTRITTSGPSSPPRSADTTC
jgi:hypothetical protein